MKITKKQLSRLIKEELEEKKNKSNKLHPSIKKIIRDDADWLIFTIKSDKDSVQYFGGRAGGSHPLPLNVSEDVKEIYLITDRSNGKKHAVVEYDDGEREYSDAQMKKTLEGLLRLKESKMKITKKYLKQLIVETLKEQYDEEEGEKFSVGQLIEVMMDEYGNASVEAFNPEEEEFIPTHGYTTSAKFLAKIVKVAQREFDND